MSGGLSLGAEICNGTAVAVNYAGGTFGGTSVAPSATINTKGSWVQLVASSAIDADFIDVEMVTGPVGSQVIALDLGVGASGSEVVVFPNLVVAGKGGFEWSIYRYLLPCSIPAGTRISARCQANVASGNGIGINARLFQSSLQTGSPSAGLDAIGFANSGTSVTAGNNALGSWAQLTSSTARDYSGFVIGADNVPTNGNNSLWLVDIGIGASGSEVVIVPGVTFGNFSQLMSVPPTFMVPIPAGTRIAARASDVNSGTTNSIGLTLYGIYN